MRDQALHRALVALGLLLVPSLALAEIEAYSFNEEGDLYRLPQVEWSPVYIGSTGYLPTALDFAPSGTLYALDPIADLLLTVDPTSGAATVVGPLGMDVDAERCDMAFDAGGQLWMTSGYDFYTVDLSTGAATFALATADGIPYPEAGWIGLTFVSDVAYTSFAGLYTVDLVTGSAHEVHATWMCHGMDAIGDGSIWALYVYRSFQEDWYYLAAFDPRTGAMLASWQISWSILYRGMAVRSVAAPAIPVMAPWGACLLALAVGVAAVATIRRSG